MGPLGEIGALFNPGMRHEIEERRRKQSHREEAGNADPGKLGIDLLSGTAVINMGSRRDQDADQRSDAAGADTERSGAERSGAERSAAERSNAEQSDAERSNAEQSDAERSDTEQSDAERSATERTDAAEPVGEHEAAADESGSDRPAERHSDQNED